MPWFGFVIRGSAQRPTDLKIAVQAESEDEAQELLSMGDFNGIKIDGAGTTAERDPEADEE